VGVRIPARVTYFSLKFPDRLCGPPNFLFAVYRDVCPEAKRLERESDHNVDLVPRLRMNGAKTPLPVYDCMMWTGRTFTLFLVNNYFERIKQ
jgi:hypothetical protein